MRNTKLPTIRYKAGNTGTSFTNINFARSEAERMADASGDDVIVYQTFGGHKGHLFTKVSPNKGCPTNSGLL